MTPATFSATPLYPAVASIYDRPSSVQVYGTGSLVAETDYAYDGVSVTGVTAYGHDDADFPASYNIRGNATAITRDCLQGCSNPAVSKYTFDQTGQMLSVTDPCGNATCTDMTGTGSSPTTDCLGNTYTSHTTTYCYSDSYSTGTPPGNTNAYITKIKRPTTNNGISHVSNYSYSYPGGQLTVAQDENGLSLTMRTRTLRPSHVHNLSGRWTDLDHVQRRWSDSERDNIQVDSVWPLRFDQVCDGWRGAPDRDTVDVGPVRHDLHRKHLRWPRTHPHSLESLSFHLRSNLRINDLQLRCSRSNLLASSARRNGAQHWVTLPVVTTEQHCVYGLLGQPTTVTDQAGVTRTTETDALGRLTDVWEAPYNGNFHTVYTYDAFDDLHTVVQGGSHARAFNYDSLKRLINASNPESGTVTYTYDANGNVSTKTDGRGKNQHHQLFLRRFESHYWQNLFQR